MLYKKIIAHTHIILLYALMLSSMACSERGMPVPEALPSDFRLMYQWLEGSLPPPHHYEYSIILSADGKGQIQFRPDYNQPGTPLWHKSFAVTRESIQLIYGKMRHIRLFQHEWKKVKNPPVGGSWAKLTVFANTREYTIPPNPENTNKLKHLYSSIEALVPKQAWKELQTKREQYIQEHKVNPK